MIQYIHPCITLIDTRTDYILLEDGTQVTDFEQKTFTHKVLYSSDLPKCLELPDAWEENPYHLLFYMIARFYFFDNGTHTLRFYYKKSHSRLLEESLASLPHRFQRITTKDENEEEYVILPGCKWMLDSIEEEWMYPYIQALYKHIGYPIAQEKKRLYISRKNAVQRRLSAEEDLCRELEKMGFEIVLLETLSFVQQIQLFRSASVIVGPHGAGLSWAVFSAPGTVLCEILPPCDNKNHYKHLAEGCNLKYIRYADCEFTENSTIQIQVTECAEFVQGLL